MITPASRRFQHLADTDLSQVRVLAQVVSDCLNERAGNETGQYPTPYDFDLARDIIHRYGEVAR